MVRKMAVIVVFGVLTSFISLGRQHSSGDVNDKTTGPYPFPVNICSWELDDGTRIEARAEKTNPPDEPTTWQITVKNLTTNKVILRREILYDLSMYLRDLKGYGQRELIIDWDHGVCCRQLEIYEIDRRGAHELLNEAYRASATLIDMYGKGKVDVLISTAEGGALPMITTRYVWQGDRYRPVGSFPSGKLLSELRNRFSERSRARRRTVVHKTKPHVAG